MAAIFPGSDQLKPRESLPIHVNQTMNTNTQNACHSGKSHTFT